MTRAARAVRCAPFQLQLFETMRGQSVSLRAIVGEAGVESQYTRRSLSELAADNALVWLIQVGMLRREVDGQGLTDSFRLTPLGRQLVEQWQQEGEQTSPSCSDHFYNALDRWFRFPI